MEVFDVVVIGGGPSGTAFAYSAFQRGQYVALIEKGSVPAKKVCGGVLSPKCWKVIQNLGMEPAVSGLPFQELKRLQVEVEPGHELEIPFPQGPIPSRVVDRSTFDAALWKFVQKAGVCVYEKTAAREITKEGGLWKIKVFHEKEDVFYARTLIGADGRNSFVAHQLGLKVKHREKSVCYQYRLKSSNFVPEDMRFFLFQDGYCGLSIDGEGCVHLDVLSLKGRESDRELMNRLFLSKSRFVEQLKKAEFYDEHPLARSPIGSGRRPFPNHGNVFLMGDAQAWFEPFTGEGIRMALESALRHFESSDPIPRMPNVSRTNFIVSQILTSPRFARLFVTCLKGIPSLSRAMVNEVLN
jgi:flavin-dependent dehydrogenase